MDNYSFNEKERYEIAAKHVKRIKGLYTHALVYLVVNSVLVYINFMNLNEGESFFQWKNFLSMAFWGIGLLAHAGSVFLPNLIFGKNWESKKIKELMEKESQNLDRYE